MFDRCEFLHVCLLLDSDRSLRWCWCFDVVYAEVSFPLVDEGKAYSFFGSGQSGSLVVYSRNATLCSGIVVLFSNHTGVAVAEKVMTPSVSLL